MSSARKLVSVTATTLVLPQRPLVPPEGRGPDSRSSDPRSSDPRSSELRSQDAAPAHPELDAEEKSGIVSLPLLLPASAEPGVRTRLGALATLGVLALGVSYGAYAVYTAARDSFVVPTIMSPTSDAVVSTKLRLGELRVDRVRAVGELEGVEADLAGADQALTRLLDLKRTTGEARQWTTRVTSQRARQNTAELTALSDQKQVLANMFTAQQRQTSRAQRDFEAGLIARAEFVRQEQALNEMRLAMLDNGRATARGESDLEETSLAQQALVRSDAPQTPELVTRQEQLIRVDLEIVRLDAERRARTAARDALAERIAQIDEMVEQIEERPLFQAMDKDLELAFVPYTQLTGMTPGAEVYQCFWGLLFCHSVGTVAERVPGEVVQADPWGSSTRGEYVVLDLKDHSAAHAKTLRVRSWAVSRTAVTPPQVSAR